MEEWELGRNFILAVVKQTLKVKSIEEIAEIIKLGLQNIKTNLSSSYILSYLAYASDFNTDNLRLEQLPGESIYTNGVWVFKADKEKTAKLFGELVF